MRRIERWTRQQWNGSNSLLLSLLGLGALIFVFERVLVFIGNAVGDHFRSDISNSYAFIITAIVFDIVAVPLNVWWLVGAWRSATKVTPRSEGRYWTTLAKVAVCVLAVGFGSFFIIVLPSMIWDQISDLRDDPQWGPRGIRLASNNRTLEVYGHISRSVVTALENALATNPDISIIDFNSIGGRDLAARQIRDIIRSRGIDTLVTTECNSACTIAFLGGRRRLIASTARMGFHSASIGGVVADRANETLREEEIREGVSSDFLDKAFSISPRSMWYPSVDELKVAGVVTSVLASARDE